jgi:membrane protein implicated in regulation of membrane protease activity
LSVVVGVSLILRNLASKAWATTVTSAALVYGVVGVFALGVAIDMVLLAGAIVLSVLALRRTVTASPSTLLRDSLTQRG